MRRTIKKSQLKRLVEETLNESGMTMHKLNEGTSEMALYDAWEECVELIGPEKMLDALFQILSHDEIRKNLEEINRQFDLDLSYFNDGDFDEEVDQITESVIRALRKN